MIETKVPEIITPLDTTRGCSKGEKNCAFCIGIFFVVWIAAGIYVNCCYNFWQ